MSKSRVRNLVDYKSQTADLDGSYVAQIVLTKGGNQKATKLIDVKAHRKLLAS